MTEVQKAWKTKASFDRIEFKAETHAHRLHASFDSEPLYTGLYNPRWPHTPAEKSKLNMDVEIERLRLEILLLQPTPSPQDDLSPRRSPAVGTGSDELGVPRAETQQTEEKGFFTLQASVDGFLSVNCTSPEQETTTILLQADLRVDDETTSTTAQAAVREEFTRPPKNRQQRRVTEKDAEQNKQFDPGG